MTNAEAIRIINQYEFNFYWTDGEKIPTEDLIEAFYMAEKALKEVDYLRSICRREGCLTCMFHKEGDYSFKDSAEVYTNGAEQIPEFLTVREAAQEMRVSSPTVYRMASRAEIPVIRIGGRLLIPRKAYDEWLKRKYRIAAARDTSTPACRRIGACNNELDDPADEREGSRRG